MFVALGSATAAAMAWLGCSSDDSPAGTTAIAYSPGGTWGAEVTVNVVGRGRVTTGSNDIDCPSSTCFGTYIFPNNTADGATGGIALTATPTPGAKFLGWSFTPDPIGSRGTGPDSCNPITRAATVPQVSASALQITLPYGQTTGTPGDAGGATCGAFTNVPLAYHVTATFDADVTESPDGAPLDSGSDAGGTVVYNAPIGATAASDIGFANGVVFFHYTQNGEETIVEGTDPVFDSNTSAEQVTSVTELELFKVFPYGAVYTDFSGQVHLIRANSFTSTAMGGATLGTCNAVAVDTSGDVFCHLTSGAIVEWTAPSYTSPVTLYSDVIGSVSDMAIDNGTIVLATTSAIETLPVNGADGGVASPTVLVSQSIPNHIAVGTARYAWSAVSTEVFASVSKVAPSSAQNTNVSIGLVSNVLVDPDSSTFFYAVGSTGIAHADAFGTDTTTVLSASIQSAATNGNVILYTAPNDAHVYRINAP